MNLQTLVVSGSVDTFGMTKEKSYDAFLINGHNCALVWLKFMFSKKATKIDEIFTVNLTLTTRCGRVMAKNIAYAKFRKSLLI